MDGTPGSETLNAGLLVMEGASDRILYGCLLNDGRIAHSGAGSLLLRDSGQYLINRASGVYDFQTDADLSFSTGGEGHFQNYGTLRKSAGTNETALTCRFSNLGGHVDVQTGTLSIRNASGGVSSNGTVSVVGFKGYPKQAAYTASKHAIVGQTKSLAVEAQEHGIRVSVVMHGGVNTELAGAARPDLAHGELLEVADVVEAVAYLLALSSRAAVDQLYVRRRNSAPF